MAISGTLLTLPAVLVSDRCCQNRTFPAGLHAWLDMSGAGQLKRKSIPEFSPRFALLESG